MEKDKGEEKSLKEKLERSESEPNLIRNWIYSYLKYSPALTEEQKNMSIEGLVNQLKKQSSPSPRRGGEEREGEE